MAVGRPLFRTDGQWARCNRDNPAYGCEMWGALVYPRCRPGYYPFACCICRPSTPNCNALGFNGGFDLSCAKRIVIGVPLNAACPNGTENNAGLCYPVCRSGYSGLGPVCWAGPPKGWVECGMGAAKDTFTCTAVIGGQVVSVLSLVANIATAGAAAPATAAAKKGTQVTTGVLAKVKPYVTKIKEVYNKVD